MKGSSAAQKTHSRCGKRSLSHTDASNDAAIATPTVSAAGASPGCGAVQLISSPFHKPYRLQTEVYSESYYRLALRRAVRRSKTGRETVESLALRALRLPDGSSTPPLRTRSAAQAEAAGVLPPPLTKARLELRASKVFVVGVPALQPSVAWALQCSSRRRSLRAARVGSHRGLAKGSHCGALAIVEQLRQGC